MSGHEFQEVATAGDLSDQLDHIANILERISTQLSALEATVHVPDYGEDIRRILDEVQGLRQDLTRP
jgi:hypothetical protein